MHYQINISKPKLIALLSVALMMALPAMTIVHALNVVTLPTNTLYADDFESYPANQKIGCSNQFTGGIPNDGWGWIDCDAGGISNITSTNYYSPSHSLMVTSPNGANGIFDVDKRFFVNNSTVLMSISIWWAVSNAYKNQAFNNHHIAIETWGFNSTGQGARYEAPVFYYSRLSGTGPCPSNSGMEIDAVGTTVLGNGGVDHVANNYCLPVYGTSTNRKAIWNHQVATVNVRTKQWVSLVIDGIDFASLICPGGVCLYMSNHGAGANDQKGDDQQLAGAGFAPFPWRFEIGAVNGATHSVPGDTWYSWQDDVVITDSSIGQPNIISFGIVASSGLFQLILITTAMMYVSSGFGTVMRVFAKDKTPKFFGPKFIIVTGVVGTAGFLFMLIVGANLVQPACPQGFTCVG